MSSPSRKSTHQNIKILEFNINDLLARKWELKQFMQMEKIDVAMTAELHFNIQIVRKTS